MLLRLTALLGAVMYCTMVILGTEQPGTMTAEAAAPDPAQAVSTRSTFSAATEPLLISAGYTAPERAVEAAVQIEQVKPKAAIPSPEGAAAETEAYDGNLLRLGALDAPSAVLRDRGFDTDAPQDGGIDVVEVTGSVVNLRTGPSTANGVVTRLRRGTRAELIETAEDGWMRIRDLDSGAEGYMFGDFLARVTPG